MSKSVFKLLGLSLFISNFSIYHSISSYDNEVLSRYETIEGENIIIDESTEGELIEIEVFGNTVQDENNLEDIQSIGDLYLDEDGNPILDSQGREQYKIKIVSENENYFNEIEIILPQQLRRVQSGNPTHPSYTDRLYWDKEKSRYIIEQNVSYRPILEDFISSIDSYNGEIEEATNGETVRKITSKIHDNEMYYSMWTQKGVIVEGFKNRAYSYYVPCESMMWDGYYGGNNIALYFSEEYNDSNKMKNYIKEKHIYIPLKNPIFIETNITSKLRVPTYEGETHIYVENKNGINPTLKVTVDRTINRAIEAIELAEINPIVENLSIARMWINLLDDSIKKDELQNKINDITDIKDLEIERKIVTANMDVYIKSENSLSISLSTNSIIFDDFSGVEDMEKLNAVEITISSSLPYQLNSYLESEIKNSDGSKIIPKELLNIRLNGENDYKAFSNINEKLVLKENCLKGNDNQFNIDLILKGSLTHKADIYKTVIKFEAEQK